MKSNVNMESSESNLGRSNTSSIAKTEKWVKGRSSMFSFVEQKQKNEVKRRKTTTAAYYLHN